MQERIFNIQRAAANDAEQLVAPKELWLTGREDELDRWYEDREARREELTTQRAEKRQPGLE